MRKRSLCGNRVVSFARVVNRYLSIDSDRIFLNYLDEIKPCVLDVVSPLGGFERRTSQFG